MSSKRIKGLTIEIDGNTTKLDEKLKDLDKQISKTNGELRDVNKLLKLDPGNTELLTQKQKLLTQQIADTKSRLEELKTSQESMKDSAGKVPEEQAEAYDALSREIIETEQHLKTFTGQQETCTKALQDGTTEVEAAKESTSEYGKEQQSATDDTNKFGAAHLDLVESLKTVGDSLDGVRDKLIDFSTQILQARDDYDSAADAMQFGLGATNEEMESYQEILDGIVGSIPVSDMTDLGDAIATVGTKTGLTGDDLQSVSEQIAELSKLSGESASSIADDAVTIAQNFDTSYGHALDVMMNASQAYGLTFDQIASMAESSGQVLTDQFGFSIEQVVGLMGTMEKSGVDSTQSITGLVKAAKNMAEDGEPSVEAFNEVLRQLADGTMSTADAQDIFGSKAGNFISFLRNSGITSVDDLTEAYESQTGELDTVSKMYDEMKDSGDDADVAQQSLKTTLAALGDTLSISLAPAMEVVLDALQRFTDFWTSMPEGMQQAIVSIGIVIGVVLTLVGGIAKVITIVQTLIPVITMIHTMMQTSPIFMVVTIIGLIVAALVTLYTTCEPFRDFVDKIFGQLKDFFGFLQDTVIAVFDATKEKLGELKDAIGEKWDAIKEKTSETFGAIKDKVSETWENLKTKTSETWDNIKTSVEEHGGGIKGVIGAAVDGYQDLWQKGFEKINELTGGKLGETLDTVKSLVGKIKDAFTEKFDAIKDKVGRVVDWLKGIFDFKWKLPDIKLPHFHISGEFSLAPPSVPHLSVDWYKKAMSQPMLLSGATIFGQRGSTLLGGGEAGNEVIMSESKYREMQSTISNNITIYQQPDESTTELADRVIERMQWKMQRGLS